MIEFERDKVGEPSQFMSKKFTDRILNFLEALGRAAFSPLGAARTEATENNVLYVLNATGSGFAACPLGLYDASDEDGAKLGVSWGTIQGRQPTGFSAGGDPAFFQAVEGSFYVYANATFDLDTLQATAAQLVIDTNPFLANTTTDAYQMIGSGVVSDDGKSVAVESVCGNVVFDPCTLVPSS